MTDIPCPEHGQSQRRRQYSAGQGPTLRSQTFIKPPENSYAHCYQSSRRHSRRGPPKSSKSQPLPWSSRNRSCQESKLSHSHSSNILKADESVAQALDDFWQEFFLVFSTICLVAHKKGKLAESLTGEEIFRDVVEAYCLCPNDQGDTSSTPPRPEAGGAQSPPETAGTTPSSSQNRNRKRRRSGQDSQDGKRPRVISRRPSSNTSFAPQLKWACPFALHDTRTYRSCLGYRLSRIVDVRLHINRQHRQKIHCPICKVTFAEQADCNDHIRECEAQEVDYEYPGATPDQWTAISTRSNDHNDDKERWYGIWDILFPGASRPVSPYVQCPEVVQVVRDYSRQFLDGGYTDTLAQQWPFAGTIDLSAAMRTVIDRFVTFVEQQEGTPNNPTTPLGDLHRRIAPGLLTPAQSYSALGQPFTPGPANHNTFINSSGPIDSFSWRAPGSFGDSFQSPSTTRFAQDQPNLGYFPGPSTWMDSNQWPRMNSQGRSSLGILSEEEMEVFWRTGGQP